MATAALRHSRTEKAIPSAHRFSRAGHVLQAEHAGTIVLFDGKRYYTLPNETANDLWSLLAEPRSLDELVVWLYDQYDAPRDVIAEDVAAQLRLLRRERLVVETGPCGEPVAGPRRWWQLWKDGG
ncbi:MAG: PqqD family protein [Gemmatimonadales bacterium]